MGLVSNELREIQIGEESQSLLPATLQNNNNSTPISDRGEFYAVEDSNFGQVLPVILEKVQMLADTPLVTDNIIIGFATPQTTLQIPFKQLDIGLQIGEGTYGVISEAKWNGQMYAVKRFKFTSKKEDIIKETEVLQRLQHECIVSLKGVTTDPSTNETRLVLEYMADGSLDDLLSRDGAHLSRADVIQIALDVAQGLHYLHSQKIIHRDLKSANVLLYNGKKRAKISDFGTVRIFVKSTNTTARVGFMAPEVLHGDPYNAKADVYSFGALLYNMFTRKNFPMLFKDAAAANVKIRSDVSDFDFQELILMCCKLEQNERPTIEACIVKEN